MSLHVSQSPHRGRYNVTLANGVGVVNHNMRNIESYTIMIKQIEGKATYFQEQDAGTVVTGTGIDSTGVTAADDGFITRVEASVSSTGTDGNTVGIYARADDGGVFSNNDAAADSATANDMILLPATPAQNDAYYIGIDDIYFNRVRNMVAGTDAVVTTNDLKYEYYNGSAWVDLTIVEDTTSGLTDMSAGTYIEWEVPSDWAEVAVNTVTCFWIRIRENHATPSYGTVPLGSQISLGVSCVIDVNVGGTTIFTTQANRPTIYESGPKKVSQSTIEAGTFAATNSLTVDVDLVATATAPQDLLVSVYGSYSDAQATAIPEQFAVAFGDRQLTIRSSAALSDSNVDIILHGTP